MNDIEKEFDAMNKVNHPLHYNSLGAKCPTCYRLIECIDVTRYMNFNIGNAIKYLWRCEHKGNKIEDLEKARWYIIDEIIKAEVIINDKSRLGMSTLP